MARPPKQTPRGQFDPQKVRVLNSQKKGNSVEATQRRLAGSDDRKTRDGGTNRRTWR